MTSADNDADFILDLGDGIVVRKYRYSDIPSLAKHANNRRLWLNLRDRFPHPYTEADSKHWVTMNQQPENYVRSGRWSSEGGSEGPLVAAHYAIVVNGEAAGSVGLEFGQDIYFRTGELGYWLGEAFWGRGIMSKVVPAFVKWSFKTFEILVRLNAEAYDENAGSIRTLVKAGFAYEGKRVNAFVKAGEVRSLVFYGALRPAE